MEKQDELTKNVGQLKIEVGLLGINTVTSCGTGIYIGNGYVLTAAHCLEAMQHANTFLTNPSHFTFNLVDKNGVVTESFKVVQYIKHPESTRDSLKNDIGLLRLERIPDLPGIKLDLYDALMPKIILKDCSTMGFGLSTTRDGFWAQRNSKIQTIKIPQIFRSNYKLHAVIGCDLCFDNDGVQYFKARSYSLEDTGFTVGMSGSPLFDSSNNLIGIASHETSITNFLPSNVTPNSDYTPTKFFKNIKHKFHGFSSAVSHITSLPVLGLAPQTGDVHVWVELKPLIPWILEMIQPKNEEKITSAL